MSEEAPTKKKKAESLALSKEERVLFRKFLDLYFDVTHTKNVDKLKQMFSVAAEKYYRETSDDDLYSADVPEDAFNIVELMKETIEEALEKDDKREMDERARRDALRYNQIMNDDEKFEEFLKERKRLKENLKSTMAEIDW